MKHLLSGVAIAAALAIAAPALAQAPMAPGGAPAASAPAEAAPAPKAGKHKRVARKAPRGSKSARARGGGSSENSMANQLNAEELARLGGGAPPMGGPPPRPRGPGGAGQGGPRSN